MSKETKQESQRGCIIFIIVVVAIVAGILYFQFQKKSSKNKAYYESVNSENTILKRELISKDTISIDGVKCYVTKREPRFTYVVTEKKVNKDSLLIIADSLKVNTSTVKYFLPNAKEDWAAIIGKDLFLYDEQIIERIERIVPDDKKINYSTDHNVKSVIDSKTKCQTMAEDFVRKKTTSPKSTKFYGGTVHEPINNNTVKLLGKFSTKNSYGVEIEYHYRIIMKFKGGEWNENNNWTVDSLEFE